MIITRALREWTCLLSLDLSGQTTQRLLGVLTQEPGIVSASLVRALVRQHGGEIRAAEAAEVEHLLAHPECLAAARPQRVTAEKTRRKAAWPKERMAAVEAALAEASPRPPQGVSLGDWERVLEVRRAEVAARSALDWLHLAKRCRELTSRIGRSRKERRELYQKVRGRLWRGEVEESLSVLEGCRGRTNNEEKLDELIGYVRNREGSIVAYGERRRKRRYIGSGGVEKANDVIVARRMKRRGMHWSEESADALAALKTLWLNQGWDRYWEQGEVLGLVAA